MDLTPSQAHRIRLRAGGHLTLDRSVSSSSSKASLIAASLTDGNAISAKTKDFTTNYPALVSADIAQATGLTGQGVTIAVLDTGMWVDKDQNFGNRLLASVDVTGGSAVAASGGAYGDGTHITSIAAGGAQNKVGRYFGIAPAANVVVVRAFDGEGQGRYPDVIAGLNWIIAIQSKSHIRVPNLSFGAPPRSYYWDDPLNQAVMAAWQAGVVVVAAVGNEGPAAMSIGIPGNVPCVITAGALTDNFTPYDPTDDKLASFSSTGPTYEGFVKPDFVAPGGHMLGSLWYQSYLANIDPNSMS